MENNNGKGIFYGVIGVATLIVAIIGATFAYFSAQAENGSIAGAAATANLTLSVDKLTRNATYDTEAKGIMVPQKDDYINDAVAGSLNPNYNAEDPESTEPEYLSCIDGNGNVACQVYKITITNSGTAATNVKGVMTLTAETDSLMTNLKWSVKAEEAGTYTNYFNATGESVKTDIIDPVNGEGSVNLAAGTSEEYYVVIWISETGNPQEDYDYGTFTGKVTFDSADGSGLTSTFTGTTGTDPDAGE